MSGEMSHQEVEVSENQTTAIRFSEALSSGRVGRRLNEPELQRSDEAPDDSVSQPIARPEDAVVRRHAGECPRERIGRAVEIGDDDQTRLAPAPLDLAPRAIATWSEQRAPRRFSSLTDDILPIIVDERDAWHVENVRP